MKFFCLLGVVLIVVSSAAAQKTPDFEAMEKGAWTAFSKGEGAYFDKLLSNDALVFMGSATSTKAELVKMVAMKPCEVKSFAFTGFKTTMIKPDVALVTYFATQDTTCGGKAEPTKVLNSSIYVNRNGNWSAFYHQESPAGDM
jgi:hypothetical protein